MTRLIRLIPLLLLWATYSCSSNKTCYYVNQYYLEFSDNGAINFYVSNGQCDFYDRYPVNDGKNKLVLKDRIFHNSPKITDPQYFRDFKKILRKYKANGKSNDGIVHIIEYDKDEKEKRIYTIEESNYIAFKAEILTLNEKYNLPERTVRLCSFYFDLVDRWRESR